MGFPGTKEQFSDLERCTDVRSAQYMYDVEREVMRRISSVNEKRGIITFHEGEQNCEIEEAENKHRLYKDKNEPY